MLKVLDSQFIQGEYYLFRDLGKLSPESKTHKFQVIELKNQSIVGHVQWHQVYRKYSFFPTNCIMSDTCLIEMALFCRTITEKYINENWSKKRFRDHYDMTKIKQKKLMLPSEKYPNRTVQGSFRSINED